MQSLSPKGDPELRAHINDGATGGYLQIYDDNANAGVMRFTEDGRVQRTGTLGLHNTGSGPIVEFRRSTGSGTVLLTVDYNAISSRTEAFAPTGSSMRVQGDHVELRTPNTSGDIARFIAGSSTRLKVKKVTPGVQIEAFTSGDELELVGEPVALARPGSSGTIVEFRAGGTLYAELNRNLDDTELFAVGANQQLEFKGKEVNLESPTNSGQAVLTRYRWDGTEQMQLHYDFGDTMARFQTPSSTQHVVHWGVAAGGDIECWFNRNNNQSSPEFRVVNGAAAATTFKVRNDGDVLVYRNSGQQLLRSHWQGSGGIQDAVLKVGSSPYRGLVEILADVGGTGRAGLLDLRDANSGDHFIWANTSDEVRVDTADPGTSEDAGTRLNAVLRIEAKTAAHTVTTSECDYLFTNDGATTGITFTLPTATVGLRYVFVSSETEQITVSASGTEKIYQDGTDQGSYASSSAVADYLSVVCFEAGRWLADRHFGFS